MGRRPFSLKEKRMDWQVALLFLACIAFSFMFYNATFNQDNMTYAIEELHEYDASLFRDNIGIMENGTSPRYFANLIASLLMTVTGASWFGIGAMIIRLNFVLYGCVAALAACKISKKNRFLYGPLLLLCIYRSTLGDMAFGLLGAEDVFLGTGIALALLGITCVIGERKNWFATWCCMALAGFMHVHEGIWGGFTLDFIWLACSISAKKILWKAVRGLPVYVAAMLLIIVPALGSLEITDQAAFINIYAFIRTPHHLLPTYWGKLTIVKSFFLVSIPLLVMVCIRRKAKTPGLLREEAFVSCSMIALWLFVLGVATVSTLIYPSAAIITMYITKCFKFVTFVAMLYLLKLADFALARKRYLCALLLLFILICGQSKFILTFLAVIAVGILWLSDFEDRLWSPDQPHFDVTLDMALWVAVLAGVTLVQGGMPAKLTIILYTILFVVKFVYPHLHFKRVCAVLLCGAMCASFLVALNGRVFRISSSGVEWISGTACMQNTMGQDLYQLSLDFQAETDSDIEFLADPNNGYAGWVQLVSQRNCYALYKCTPSSQNAVLEWYDRIENTAQMKEMDAQQLSELMRRLQLEYVLIFPDQFDRVANAPQLEVVVQNDAAAVYKLR